MATKKTENQALPVKKKKKATAAAGVVDAEPNEISTMLNGLLKNFGRPPVMDDDECKKRIVTYFNECLATGSRPIWEELCMTIGVDVTTVRRWEKKELLANTNRSAIIKQARAFMASFDAKAVSEGKMNPVTYIFRSKNFYGMTDQQEHVITPNVPIGEVKSVELIEQSIEDDLIE